MKDLDKTKSYSLKDLKMTQAFELLEWLKKNDGGWSTYTSDRFLNRCNGLLYEMGQWVFYYKSCDESILSLFEKERKDNTLVDSIKQLVEKISELRFKREDSLELPTRPLNLGYIFDVTNNKGLCKVQYFEVINFDDTSWRLILEGSSMTFDGGLGLLTTLDADRNKILSDVKKMLETYLPVLEKVAVNLTKESKLDEYLTKAGYEQGEERERVKKLIVEYNDFNPDLK